MACIIFSCVLYRHEAAYKVLLNHEAIVKFALRGAGSPGAKQFQVKNSITYVHTNKHTKIHTYISKYKIQIYIIYQSYRYINLYYHLLFVKAPLADPYAVPNLTYTEEMSEILKSVKYFSNYFIYLINFCSKKN